MNNRQLAEALVGQFKVYCKGEHPKPKKIWKSNFAHRQQARQWCRNHQWECGGPENLVIVHPDGKEESYK